MSKTKVLFPGEFISNEEEFMSGSGTYAEDGKIYASAVGELEKDLDRREVRVLSPFKIPVFQRKGITVIGKVEQVKDKMAFISLAKNSDDHYRYIPRDASTILRVTDVKRSFVKSLKDEIKVGDYIRANIIEADRGTVLLSIDGKNLGVIQSSCARCRSTLVKEDQGLKCSECGFRERRKLAMNYGETKE